MPPPNADGSATNHAGRRGGRMSLGQRITELRQSMSLSEAGFAERAGIDEKNQIRYEKGKAEPGVNYLNTLVKLGGSLTYLVTGRHPEDDLFQPRNHAELMVICEKLYREKAINHWGLLDGDVDEIIAIFQRRGGWPLLAEGLFAGAVVPSEAHAAIKQWRKEHRHG
ncbi:helix-turn-helix transcriptional regulator [Methylomonas sp. MV1]|uniref:helix-turn-helix domain-containing protein n=1 Tax=Methylomonas sp. MV1 TaxID=3073620 RepID=UPI0028A4317B|nr:helix-turn-helix transcriptional regulator [Methylomonas sp. MV1]MDT4329783.1 helix-turn-helix transcriptional regulator [Methylomonas sp. MV1]